MRAPRIPEARDQDVRAGTLGAAIGQYPVFIAMVTLAGLGAGALIASRLTQLLRTAH